MEDNTARAVDLILSDWPAKEIREKFDFMFQQTLQMSDGMAGPDLAEMFEMLNRISTVFNIRETDNK